MLFLIVITLIIFSYFIFQDIISENFVTLYKCPKLSMGVMYDKVLSSCNIHRINNKKQCDIYMPCGYNNVENELKTLKIYNTSQNIYGINGCDNIVSKNGLWNILEEYYGRTKARLLMPESYILNSRKNMNLFKKDYNPNTIYLLKKNIQRKLGIVLSQDLDFILDKQNTSFKVVQKYVDNLFLIKRRKINLRLYLLIICKKQNIKAYIHKLGKCIYTNKNVDDNSITPLDPEKHLTSLNLSKKAYDDRPETLNDLRNYLGETRYFTLMNNININLISVIKAVSGKICNLQKIQNNLSFQLFGIDYLFNTDMYPYLLEMNKGPDMSSKSNIDTKTKQTVLSDVFKVTNIIENSPKHMFLRIN